MWAAQGEPNAPRTARVSEPPWVGDTRAEPPRDWWRQTGPQFPQSVLLICLCVTLFLMKLLSFEIIVDWHSFMKEYRKNSDIFYLGSPSDNFL